MSCQGRARRMHDQGQYYLIGQELSCAEAALVWQETD